MFRIGILCLVVSYPLRSQDVTAIHQAFLDLRHDGVLMNISAHPDDEDGATLAFYRMKFGVKTYSVMFTRGEGGQNEKGPELYERLGVLRTAETEAAATILGTEVFFLNFMDFGFSKNATESFQKWGGSREALRRLVYAIRKLRPDVIFTNHNTIDGHGHHQAVAITAIAAFDAAADSTFFPEQLREPGITLWQPRKLFFRNFSRVDTTADVVNAIGEIDSVRMVSYFDIAVQALQMHKTQGLDRANLRAFTRGISKHKLVRSNSLYDKDSTTFFSGIDFWRDEGLKELHRLHERILSLREGLTHDTLLSRMSSFLDDIAMLRSGRTSSVLAGRLLTQWQHELETLAMVLCGVKMRLTLSDPVVVAKQRVPCTLDIESDDCALEAVRYRFDLPAGWAMNAAAGSPPVTKARSYSRDFSLVVGDDPIMTLPAAIAQYRPIETQQTIEVVVDYRLDGHELSASTTADVDVAPRQTLSVQPKVARISKAHPAGGKTFEYVVKNYLPHKTAGTVRVMSPPGWRSESSTFAISSEDSTATGKIAIRPPDGVTDGDYTVTFKTDLASDDVIVKVFEVGVANNLSVGVVRSYDDVIESTLNDLGVRYMLLKEEDLSRGDLSRYGTIIIDIRGYLVRDDLKNNNARLLEYVSNGGNLVVMYQRDQEWKPEYAPFPFQISRRRVTVEEAPIAVLVPGHPLFNLPNRITDEAWVGWKQERAVYFPASVSSEYTQLLSSHDPDEADLTTGYLVADVGAGSYIYTSYVWYRQMKELHRGALACFANMISYPKYRRSGSR